MNSERVTELKRRVEDIVINDGVIEIQFEQLIKMELENLVGKR